jgi:hypothetical protein
MKKLILELMFTVFLSVLGCMTAFAGEIAFISTHDEYLNAMKADKIKGIAIRSEFFNSAGPIVKSQIGYLVNINKNKLIPIFFYGYDINRAVFNKLINKNLIYGCDPIILAGYFGTFPLVSADFRGRDIEFCGAGANEFFDGYEARFREWIENYWMTQKEELKLHGYATI